MTSSSRRARSGTRRIAIRARPSSRRRANVLDAFPDIQVEVEDTAADGDHVVVCWRARGTHRGDGLGIPATGRSVDFRRMTWLTFKNGVIVEGRGSWNLGRLLESLR